MDEIKPVVRERGEIDYQDESFSLALFGKLGLCQTWNSGPKI